MSGFGAGLAGLSQMYPAYLTAEKNQATADKSQYDFQLQKASDQAFGRSLQLFNSPMPGAMPMAPAPGQPSVPAAAPPGLTVPGGGMPGGGPPAPGAGPAGPGVPAAGAPGPSPSMAGGMPPQGQPGQGGGQGGLDWRLILQKVTQANPGVPPQVIAGAVDRWMPLMNAAAQQQWREVAQQIRMMQVQQGESRIEQGQARLDQAREAEDRRREQGQQRLDLGQKNLDERTRQFDIREKRLEASAAVRADQGYQRLDVQRQNLERSITQGNQRNLISQWRAVLDAQHKRAIEVIQSNSGFSNLDDKQKKALLEDQNKAYDDAIQKMRAMMGQSTPQANQPKADGTKTQEKMPQSGPAAPGVRGAAPPAAQGSASIPPEAAKQLKEGQVTTFNNGQKWTLQNGQPVQVDGQQ